MGLTVFHKLETRVTAVAVQDQQSVFANSTASSMAIEMLNPFDSNLLISPAIGTDVNDNVLVNFIVDPRCLDSLAFEDDKR